MKLRRIVYLVAIIVFAFSACQYSGKQTKNMDYDMAPEGAPAPMKAKLAAAPMAMEDMAQEELGSGAEEPTAPADDRKIIYTASMTVEVKSTPETIEQVKVMMDGFGGYVADTQIEELDNERKNAWLTLKVPAKNFDNAILELGKLGRVKAQESHGQDVTEAYFDLEIRLANAKRLEARMLDLLEKETKKLKDMLEVERELARVREKIEIFEGRKRFMDNRISLSTINLRLIEPYKITSSIMDPVKAAFEQAGGLFMSAVGGIIVFFAVAIPWFVLIGIFVFIIVRVIKRWRRKKVQKAKEDDN